MMAKNAYSSSITKNKNKNFPQPTITKYITPLANKTFEWNVISKNLLPDI